MKHVLVVEDELKMRNLLRDYLEAAGFRVSSLDQGDTVIAFVKKHSPDVILLDIMLPGKDGIDVCREIRTFSKIPIMMITARIEEAHRILGLESGADDYICKPFSPREVVARVKAILRRIHPVEEKTIKAGMLELHQDARQLKVNGQDLRLTPIEYGLLKIMLKWPNRVFSRNELIDHIQGDEFEGFDRTIDTHIKNLRRKIATVISDQEIIHSVYGVGYKVSFKED